MMPEMRVLHAVHGFPPEFLGGVEAYVAALAASQRGRGDDASVLAGSDREAPAAVLREEEVGGVPVARLAGLAPHTERLRDRPDGEALVRALLETLRPDVLHVHSWLRLVPSLASLAAAEGIPSVATLHDLSLSCPRVHRLKPDLAFCRDPESPALCTPCARRDPWESEEEAFEELALRELFLARERALLAVVLAPSDTQRNALEGLGTFPPGRISVEPVAIPFLPTPPAGAGRARDGLSVGHWGNLLPAKGTHLLAEAVSALPEALGVRLHLFGTAPDPEFEARLRAASSHGRVFFHGPYAPGELGSVPLDAAAFPSLAHESHSFTLDEAFSLGLPVVVSDAGALAARAGGRGLVVPAGDVGALAEALRRLAAEPGLLEALRAAPPAEPPTAFDGHVARLGGHYAEAIRSGPRSASGGPSADERLRALQRRASRRLVDAVAARRETDRLRVESDAALRSRDLELRRLYDAEAALRAEATSLGERLARTQQDVEAERHATGATRGQLEALLARRSVRLALRLSRLLGRP
jgi:glycosyltransferase involved in cell wall biosynthesis